MKTDFEIARAAKLQPIDSIAKKIGIKSNDLFCYGKYMAKAAPKAQNTAKKNSKLILVTAINPTKAGEGKTTISIGLADALTLNGHKAALALREPSLGPVFGTKGGAAGGGYAQIAPMDDINLHFTGDMHAITSANNLLAALIDNHIYWGNELAVEKVLWRRCIDMNDRALRVAYVENAGKVPPREENFTITAASEIMAVLCLCDSEEDLKNRLGAMVVAEDKNGKYLTAKDFNAVGALMVTLKDALKPNLVQTLEGTPAFVHGGPFANIAHGCNSIIATKTALSYADFVITEAGFGADLGAEKFFDIKCRTAGLTPDAVVIVATLRALKALGGKQENLGERDLESIKKGFPNLQKHIENITKGFKLPCVVALNQFALDSEEEIGELAALCKPLGVEVVAAESFANGGKGGIKLTQTVVEKTKQKSMLQYCYELTDSLQQKIEKVATKIYGAKAVEFLPLAKKVLDEFQKTSYAHLPICIAKTQYSLSDNPNLLGKPTDFVFSIKDIQLRAGAGFFVVLAGDILLMPGLGKKPNAENIDVKNGVISGLF